MATLININSRRIIRARVSGRTWPIRLGKISQREANRVLGFIDDLEAARKTGLAPAKETMAWLHAITPLLHRRIAAAGLVRGREALALDAYFANYIARRGDLKPHSIACMEKSRASLVAFFGKDKDLSAITAGDVKDWHRSSLQGHAVATVAMFTKRARQIYADAIDRKLLTENPFRSIKAGSMTNPARQFYVHRAEIQKVIDSIVDPEWRALFAIARYAGLRVPSEIRGLTWGDVRWGENGKIGRLRIHSPKTEHHAGKAVRTIPLYPELEPYLMALHELADSGSIYVFPRLRLSPSLSALGAKRIDKSGVAVWPKVFQNMRASCETDLSVNHPMQVVCCWMGNSTGVALAHYLMVTDADFERVVKSGTETASASASNAGGKPQLQAVKAGELFPAGTEHAVDLAGITQEAHRLIQKSLRGARARLAHTDAAGLRRLAREIAAARGRGRTD